MDTTTSDDGAQVAQPQETEAEAVDQSPQAEENASQTQDQPNESTADSVESNDSEEQPQEEAPQQESQADDDDIQAWAEKKGLPMDDPVKLAKMYKDAEKKMHEVTQNKPKMNVKPPEFLEETGDERYDAIVQRQNQQELRTYVRDWYEANPDMREHHAQLSQIAQQYPDLQSMDHIKAHFLAQQYSDPKRLESLKKEGGREALTNLAQKQQQTPPSSGATNSNSYASKKITAANVDDMVANMSVDEYQKRLPEINAAIRGS